MSTKEVAAEVTRQLKEYCELTRREENFDASFLRNPNDLPPIKSRGESGFGSSSYEKKGTSRLHERSLRRLDEGGHARNLLTYLEQKSLLTEPEKYLRRALENISENTTPNTRRSSGTDSNPAVTAGTSTSISNTSKRAKTGKIRERLGSVPRAEAERLVSMATKLIVATESLLRCPESKSNNCSLSVHRVGALPLVDSDSRWKRSDELQVEKIVGFVQGLLSGRCLDRQETVRCLESLKQLGELNDASGKDPPWEHQTNRRIISSSRSYSQIANSHLKQSPGHRLVGTGQQHRQVSSSRRSRSSRALAPLAQLISGSSSAATVSPLPRIKPISAGSRKVPPTSPYTSNVSADSNEDSVVGKPTSHRRKTHNKLRDKTAQTEMRIPDCVRGHWCVDEDQRFRDLSNERWLEDTWKRSRNKAIESPPPPDPQEPTSPLNETSMVVFEQKFKKQTMDKTTNTTCRNNSDTAYSETSLTSGTETGLDSACGGCSDCEGLADSEEELLKKDDRHNSNESIVPRPPERCLDVDVDQIISQHSPGVVSSKSGGAPDTRSLEEDSAFATDGSSLDGGETATLRHASLLGKKTPSRYVGECAINYQLLRTESQSKDKDTTDSSTKRGSSEEEETESGSKTTSDVFDEDETEAEDEEDSSASSTSSAEDETLSSGSTCSCDDCRANAATERLRDRDSESDTENVTDDVSDDDECHACRVENEGCCSHSSSTASILAESAITPRQKRALSPEVIIRNPLINALQDEEEREKRRLEHASQQMVQATVPETPSNVNLPETPRSEAQSDELCSVIVTSANCDINNQPGTSTAETNYLKPEFSVADIMHKSKPLRKGLVCDDETDDEESYQQLSEEEFVARLSIHEAARCGDLHVVKLLLKSDFKRMETVDERGWTPIHLAAANGHTEVVSFLAKEGAHMAALDPSGYTGIHIAAMNGHLECVEVFLENGIDVDTVTADGFTPLHLAALNDFAEICKLLLSWGASMSRQDALGRTVTDMAEEYSLVGVGKLLESFHQHLESFKSVMKMLSNKQSPENSSSRLPRDILKMITTIATAEDSS